MTNNSTPIDRADLLVGRFFRLFGAIETELNVAIRKLFELPSNSAEIVCANLEFFKKLSIVRSALNDQDVEGKHKDKIKGLFSRILEMNNRRAVGVASSSTGVAEPPTRWVSVALFCSGVDSIM